MATVKGPTFRRTEPYYKTKYRCTNPGCKRSFWAISQEKGRICPKCYAHVEAIEVKRVVPTILVCHYCRRSDCAALH